MRGLCLACAVAFAAVLFLLPLASSPVAQESGEQSKEAEYTVRAKVPLQVPDVEKRRKNPVPAGKESIERGGRLFASQCAMCHGEKGDGTGELAGKLEFELPDFTRPEALRNRTDGELYYVLTHGCRNMPGDDRLSDEWKWDLINHIRSMSSGG